MPAQKYEKAFSVTEAFYNEKRSHHSNLRPLFCIYMFTSNFPFISYRSKSYVFVNLGGN